MIANNVFMLKELGEERKRKKKSVQEYWLFNM